MIGAFLEVFVLHLDLDLHQNNHESWTEYLNPNLENIRIELRKISSESDWLATTHHLNVSCCCIVNYSMMVMLLWTTTHLLYLLHS